MGRGSPFLKSRRASSQHCPHAGCSRVLREDPEGIGRVRNSLLSVLTVDRSSLGSRNSHTRFTAARGAAAHQCDSEKQ